MTGRHGGPGTLPPVPGSPSRFPRLARFARLPGHLRDVRRPAAARAVSAALLLPLLLLAVLSWQVTVGGPTAAADGRLARALRANAPPAGLAEFLADLGNAEVALPVLAAALGYAWLRGRRRRPRPAAVPAAVLAMAAVPAAVVPLKALTDRPGPLGGTGYFPSGHAVTALVAYGAAALLVLPYVRAAARRALTAAAALVCAGVGAGLVWRGYHWPLDVLGGWCLGVPLLAAVRWAARRAPGPPDPRRGRARR
ncbi:phosphatase PAP2 family protein [Streptomyces sp. TRM 70361]|uniref:phosphatase PAP2 family protein n=1 Tax=Streptomyces sp. TRM 70361 TaxID=3116553 RepID=UPI002E7C52EE|nr:phosphatase PAP2 family protein [Streptomyces sp. TRM 70361]MEE1941821.1 phosphatase PAP2 family protein [Streptomyces sp. TRM 70361]